MSALRLGALAYPVTAPDSLDAFEAKIDGLIRDGAAGGGQLLLLPEYAAMEVAAGLPGAGNVTAELAAVCAQTPRLIEIFAAAARRHRIWLQPGTVPWQEAGPRTAGKVRNRAPLIAPDGSIRYQDKSTMTRFEAEQWGISAGRTPRVFDTEFGRIGIAICYDVEFPPLVRAQVAAGAWLILAPSCTDSLHGFNRVRLSARARALENQCYVAVAPTVGQAPGLATLDENHGYAGIFGPVDRGFPDDGIIAQAPLDQPGWVFADLDPSRLDHVRANGAVRNHRDWPSIQLEPSEPA